jgi:hypothetical protein
MEVNNFSNNNSEFAFEAKSFLETCCQNVVKSVEDIQKKEHIRLMGEKLFYKNYIDRIQIKFFVYKLNETKLRTYAEDNFNKSCALDSEKKKQWNESKKDSLHFLNSVTKKVSHDYTSYMVKVEEKSTKIQKRFRGYLARLIHKMELMNFKIEEESRLAEERVRRKVSEKKKLSTSSNK